MPVPSVRSVPAPPERPLLAGVAALPGAGTRHPFLLDHLTENRRLEDAQPDLQADRHHNDAQQKRNAPTPTQELFARHSAERRDGEVRQEESRRSAKLRPRRDEPAAPEPEKSACLAARDLTETRTLLSTAGRQPTKQIVQFTERHQPLGEPESSGAAHFLRRFQQSAIRNARQ
jgi:hypothetical protein